MTGPPCKCHGEPQRWNKDRRYTAGGFWKCRRLHLEWNRKRLRAGRMYLGVCGFTKTETEAMLDGSSK